MLYIIAIIRKRFYGKEKGGQSPAFQHSPTDVARYDFALTELSSPSLILASP